MIAFFAGLQDKDIVREGHPLPQEADPVAIIDEVSEALEQSSLDDGPEDRPAMEDEAYAILRAEIIGLREVSDRIPLVTDPVARAAMERERRKALIAVVATVSRYYLRLAEWADQSGPKLAFRLVSIGAVSALLGAIGFIV